MLGASGRVEITNKLIQIGELFSEEFKEPLKGRVLEVFNEEVDRLLSERMDKLKGPKGNKGDQGEAGKDGLDGKNGLDGKDGLNGANGKDGANAKDGIDGKNGLDGANGKDGLGGKDGLNGNDGLDGKDGLDAELDYEFIKKEIAWLFEEWKSNLGDLTGKQGERGEKGKDGSEYPTYEKQLLSDDMVSVVHHQLPMTNAVMIVSVVGISNLSNFIRFEEEIIFQNVAGQGKLLSKGYFVNGAPKNKPNLTYSIDIVGGFLNVSMKGKTDEIFDITVVLK